MNGLEKLVSHITAEDQEKAERLRAEAKAEAEAILEKARRQSDEQCAAVLQHAEDEVKNRAERGAASAALKKRQILLRTKQNLVNEMIDRAMQEILNLPDAEYFAFLEKLFMRHAPKETAELCFNQKDLDRLGETRLAAFQAAAKEQGGEISLCREPVNIRGGFVLRLGDIEENCAIEALIADKTEALQDEIGRLLFDGKAKKLQAGEDVTA